MAQSRDTQSKIDENLNDLYLAFKQAFISAGHEKLFEVYWAIIKPAQHAYENVEVIDAFYQKQLTELPNFLEAVQVESLSLDKQLILKYLNNLCHRLERHLYFTKQLATLDLTNHFQDACTAMQLLLARLQTQILSDSSELSEKAERVKQYLFQVGKILNQLGYFVNADLINHFQSPASTLPPEFESVFSELRTTAQLNALTDQLHDVDRRKDHAAVLQKQHELQRSIGDIQAAHDLLCQANSDIISSFGSTISQAANHQRDLSLLSSQAQAHETIFRLLPILTGIMDERCCPGMDTIVKNLSACCTQNSSTWSWSYLRGNDPWRAANNQLFILSRFNNQLEMHLKSYTGSQIDLHALSQAYQTRLNTVNELGKACQQAEALYCLSGEAVNAYEQSLLMIVQVLKNHTQRHTDESPFDFLKHHWAKMLGGSVSGGVISVSVTLILTTNPWILAGLVPAGLLLGTAGGTGTGLICDMYDRKKEKMAAVGAASGYGTLWHHDDHSSMPAAAISTSANLGYQDRP